LVDAFLVAHGLHCTRPGNPSTVGARRLRERGARIALVCTNADNAATVALYESVGFRVVRRNVI
jgi:hypothetical protein